MAYIGKSPAVGNFVKLDAISTSSTNTYNLTLDSVAFTPESANHMLVSLNGVIQAPLTAFSVSGSTITFLPSSGTLSSSDVIDFIMVYGNVLDIGTPSDSTVTNAKTNFVSTSSSAGLQIKGDGTTAGTLQLNCEQNSHGIKLRSPAHSSGQSYTIVYPTSNITAGKFLKVDSVSGSGTTGIGQLSFADASGSSDAFHAYDMAGNASGDLVLTSELYDDGGNYNTSNGRYTAPSDGTYLFTGGATPTSGTADISFKKNGSNFAGGTDSFAYATNDPGQGNPSLIINLSSGDYINLNANTTVYNNYVYFNGVKLY